jgi:hypothetical protein
VGPEHPAAPFWCFAVPSKPPRAPLSTLCLHCVRYYLLITSQPRVSALVARGVIVERAGGRGAAAGAMADSYDYLFKVRRGRQACQRLLTPQHNTVEVALPPKRPPRPPGAAGGRLRCRKELPAHALHRGPLRRGHDVDDRYAAPRARRCVGAPRRHGPAAQGAPRMHACRRRGAACPSASNGPWQRQ